VERIALRMAEALIGAALRDANLDGAGAAALKKARR